MHYVIADVILYSVKCGWIGERARFLSKSHIDPTEHGSEPGSRVVMRGWRDALRPLTAYIQPYERLCVCCQRNRQAQISLGQQDTNQEQKQEQDTREKKQEKQGRQERQEKKWDRNRQGKFHRTTTQQSPLFNPLFCSSTPCLESLSCHLPPVIYKNLAVHVLVGCYSYRLRH